MTVPITCDEKTVPIVGRARREHGRGRLWQQMKIHRRFSPGDLAAPAEVSVSHAQRYCRVLAAVGLLKVVAHRPLVYALPKRAHEKDSPRIYCDIPGLRRVLDPNTGVVHEEARDERA